VTVATHKKPSQKERIIALLSDRLWHTTEELNDLCYRYGARLFELRREGYVFTEERIGKGPLWRWRLEKTPEQVALEPHLERTNEEIAERAERLSGAISRQEDGPATESHIENHGRSVPDLYDKLIAERERKRCELEEQRKQREQAQPLQLGLSL
jgi:hypothetical protein